MNRAMYAAVTGMAAQQTNLDTLANNLANADVAGFKGAAASFTDIAAPGSIGLGTASLGSHTVFEQGKLMKSGGPFDLAIDGSGFFSVTNAAGERAYTRDGEFSRSADGHLRNAQDWMLAGVRIPAEATGVTVSSDGVTVAQTPHGPVTCGRVRLAEFAAPEHLESVGGTLFRATAQSGRVKMVNASALHGPQIKFGMLEKSNVSIIESMMQILAAQRAYEANAKGVQAADEMLRIANNLNRG
ncbi:MAG: flagellar hook-basal body protein [Candidatus Eremiobacteraeota bacterium]|nr:flagellar hook-basal body protein [Candidatus Eremiobacteraeota bacterium]